MRRKVLKHHHVEARKRSWLFGGRPHYNMGITLAVCRKEMEEGDVDMLVQQLEEKRRADTSSSLNVDSKDDVLRRSPRKTKKPKRLVNEDDV
eukprot:m.28141 g.28141  ORF g.28141 m.28141 type:complete len:92 (+) comp9436_c0_seq1:314-589(+)